MIAVRSSVADELGEELIAIGGRKHSGSACLVGQQVASKFIGHAKATEVACIACCSRVDREQWKLEGRDFHSLDLASKGHRRICS